MRLAWRPRPRAVAVVWMVAAVTSMPQASAAPARLSVSAVLEGTRAIVSGTVEHEFVPFQPPGVESSGDDLTKGAGLGGDLKGFALDLESDGDVVVRWHADLPAPTQGAPGFVYGAVFMVNGEGYELDVSRVTSGPSTEPKGSLWKCEASCELAEQRLLDREIPARMDPETGYVTATIPATHAVAKPGDLFEPVAQHAGRSTFIELGMATYPIFYGLNDGLDQDWTLFVPGLRVDIAVGEPGQDPVAFYNWEPAEIAGSRFSASILARRGDVVYARACSGATCSYAASSPLA